MGRPERSKSLACSFTDAKRTSPFLLAGKGESQNCRILAAAGRTGPSATGFSRTPLRARHESRPLASPTERIGKKGRFPSPFSANLTHIGRGRLAGYEEVKFSLAPKTPNFDDLGRLFANLDEMPISWALTPRSERDILARRPARSELPGKAQEASLRTETAERRTGDRS